MQKETMMARPIFPWDTAGGFETMRRKLMGIPTEELATELAFARLEIAALREGLREPYRPLTAAADLPDWQRRQYLACAPAQAVDDVRREREAMANRGKPHPQPDGFINDYD